MPAISPPYMDSGHLSEEVIDRFGQKIVEAAREKHRDIGDALDWIVNDWPGPVRDEVSRWLSK